MFLSSNMMNIKLLLIEDDEDDYVLTRDLLNEIARGQYSLDWASSAEAARATLSRNVHDVCLMDYRLGHDDGITLLEQAPLLGFTAPIIMLTGQDDSELDISALKAGAVDYLVKSQLNGARLARAIRYAVARREVEVERIERLRAEAESRSKSDFLAHLSHELRTPLTAILGYADILLHRSSDAKDEADLLTIRRNGQHLLSLLNDVLDMSKIAAGKLEINKQGVELNSFLADLRSLMGVAAQEKNLKLRFFADEALPAKIETDPIRLRQILINLIGNAIKFTEQGFVEVEIQAQAEASHMTFIVRDSGVGIEAKVMSELFQPFSQGAVSRLQANQGSGLGLTISKQLAARLGGDITVSSTPGVGSTFTLYVDVGPINPANFVPLSLSAKTTANTQRENIRIAGHVLVVDDLPDIRHLIGEIISSAGAKVSYATDGAEAIDRYRTASQAGDAFDLIIMDVQMPTVDGLTASKQLRREGCHSPILALTAATMQGEKERCLIAGCNDYLSKPVEESALLRAVQQLLTQADKVVLLVEDNDDARQATRELLILLGWDVLEAASGAAAHDLVQQAQPRLALVDLSLPDMSGYDLIKQLREGGLATTRFMTLSGFAGDLAKEQETGVHRHLLKPLGLSELQTALNMSA